VAITKDDIFILVMSDGDHRGTVRTRGGAFVVHDEADVFGSKAGMHLINSDGAGGGCCERILGRACLLIQRVFDGSITRRSTCKRSRMISLSVAYSRVRTLAFTASAMSSGRVMLGCVVRTAASKAHELDLILFHCCPLTQPSRNSPFRVAPTQEFSVMKGVFQARA